MEAIPVGHAIELTNTFGAGGTIACKELSVGLLPGLLEDNQYGHRRTMRLRLLMFWFGATAVVVAILFFSVEMVWLVRVNDGLSLPLLPVTIAVVSSIYTLIRIFRKQKLSERK